MKRKVRISRPAIGLVLLATLGALALSMVGKLEGKPRAGDPMGAGGLWLRMQMALGVVRVHSCSPRQACIANLKQIEEAKQTWQIENKKSLTDWPARGEMYGTNAYLRSAPSCPEGGIYRIGQMGVKPLCTITGHSL